MFKKRPSEDEPNTGPLSFNRNHKFPATKDLPKIEPLVLEDFFRELEEYRKVASECE